MITTGLRARDYAIVAAGAVVCTTAIVLLTLVLDFNNLTTLSEETNRANFHSDLVIPTLLGLPAFSIVFLKIRQLTRMRQYLESLAFTDSLTGVLNRRAFQDRVNALLAEKPPRRSALLVIDLDHFKQVNDNLGHDAGDQALVMVANLISAQLCNGEIFGRIGGEEFVVFIPATTRQHSALAAEMLRLSVEDMAFGKGALPSPLTISIGLATTECATSFTSLYRAADRCLYRAKKNGRNRVEQSEFGNEDPVEATPGLARHVDAA